MSIDNAEDAAVLWAMDHGPEQRWEDEAEIDYTQLQQQASADKRQSWVEGRGGGGTFN